MIAALLLMDSSAPGPAFDQTIPGSLVTFKMVPIPAGKINLGGKVVEFPKGFYAGATEVTWDAYDIFAYRLDLTQEQQAAGVEAKTRPSKPYGAPDRGFGHKGFAAIGIHSNAAIAYAEWLSAKTGRKFRIPTEAEWEYMARGGAAAEPALDDVAWYWDNSDDTTKKVGSKKPNAWGVFDALGNAAEWAIGEDGTPVTRGGHYLTRAKNLTFGLREPYMSKWQQDDAQIPKSKWWLSNGPTVGFRVVADP